MGWTYYLERCSGDLWFLMRAKGRRQEAFNFKRGWIESDILEDKRIKGDIGDEAIISEPEALDLIASRTKSAES